MLAGDRTALSLLATFHPGGLFVLPRLVSHFAACGYAAAGDGPAHNDGDDADAS